VNDYFAGLSLRLCARFLLLSDFDINKNNAKIKLNFDICFGEFVGNFLNQKFRLHHSFAKD